MQKWVYLSAEEVDNPVHNVSCHVLSIPYGKTCETSYKPVPAEFMPCDKTCETVYKPVPAELFAGAGLVARFIYFLVFTETPKQKDQVTNLLLQNLGLFYVRMGNVFEGILALDKTKT